MTVRKTVHKSNIWLLEHEQQSSGKMFEVASRTPGIRLLIENGSKLLLNKESRHELGGRCDLRLPGGKVFDSLDDWLAIRNFPDQLLDAAKKAAVREAHEECGLIINESDLKLLKRDINGGKSEWDLYYFYCDRFQIDPNGPSYDDTEEIEIYGWDWYSKETALEIALDAQSGMSESRSARYVAAWAKER